MKPRTTLPVEIGYEFTAFGERTVEVDALLHTLLIGKSRTGKSTAMLGMMVGAARAGLGFECVDPHGTLISAFLNYVPKDRLDDIVIIDPLSHKIPGLGYFDAESTELATQFFMSNMEARSGRGWGARTAEVFRGAADAVSDFFKRPTILEIYRFLTRDDFALAIMEKSKNPLVQDFCHNWYSSEVKPRDRREAFSHPRNKIDELMRPGVREFVTQKSSLDFAKLMDSKKIVLVSVPKGKIGSMPAKTIGTLALMNTMLAAFNRKKPQNRFPIFIDEAHNFLDGIDFETALAEAAKQGINYVLGTQTLAQMRDEERKIFNDDIALGNVSSVISFRVSGRDSQKIALEFADVNAAPNLVKLENYTCYTWATLDNKPILKGPVVTFPAPEKWGDEVAPEKALAWARNNTGTERALIEADYLKRIARKVGSPRPSRSSSRNRNRS